MRTAPEVLLVDDNPADLDLTNEVLKQSLHTFGVHTAADGVEAIAFLRRQGGFTNQPRPDLIVLDLNLPRKHGREVLTEIKNDPELSHPTKPIGSFYGCEEVERIRREKPHWNLEEMERGRWRRVVPSPRPVRILEEKAIARLVEAGVVVIACGGGGIPVAWREDRLIGVEGVIDKDLASSLLARDLNANKLIILTSVERIALGFGRPGQRWIDSLTVRQACQYLAAGEFPPGSMGPKVQAGIEFVAHGGEECIITSAEHVTRALRGEAGTRIVPS